MIATPAERLDGSREEFVRDVLGAVAAWRRVPWLPVVSFFVGGPAAVRATGFRNIGSDTGDTSGAAMFDVIPDGLIPVAGGLIFVGVLAVAVFATGWTGTERWVYERAWGRERVSFGAAVRETWGYVGRFLVLGLVVVLPSLVATVLLSLAVGPVVADAVVTFLMLVTLTFVPPALVYDDRRVAVALRRGWRLLREQGRRAWWYAGVTPAVLTAVAVALGAGGVVTWLAWAVAGLMALALRGAVAAAYLRLTS